MHDIIQIKLHALKAVANGQDESACPFIDDSTSARMWLDYFRAQVRWLAGQTLA